MKITLVIVSIILGLVLALGVIQTVASERIEVIQLHTTDEQGKTHTTRLWIVDDDGRQYLRGDVGGGWVTRLLAYPSFELTRGEQTKTYAYKLRPDKIERINTLMREKYTWGDAFIALLGAREESQAIELHPLEGG